MIRFFSLAHFGSYIYIPISVAILGFGAAATFISIFEKKILLKSDLYLGISLVAAIFFTSTGFLILKQIELHPDHLLGSYFFLREILSLFLFYFFLLLPFFFAAFFIVLSFHIEKNHLGHLSLFNNVGSALGAVLFVIIVFFIPIDFMIFIPVLLLSAGAFLIISNEKKYKVIFFSLTLISLMLPLVQTQINPMPYKDIVESLKKGGKVVYEQESPFGDMKVVRQSGLRLPVGISSAYKGEYPDFMQIFIDGNRFSEFVSGKETEFLNYTPYRLAFELKPRANTLILRSGGGIDVFASIFFNAKNIDAVEKNFQAVELLKDKFSNYTAGIYHNRNVLFYRSEIRSFVATHAETYDLIQLRLPPFRDKSFREEPDYTLTLEAFEQYFDLLALDGVMTVSLSRQDPPRLELRVLSTLKKLLEEKGRSFQNHLTVIKTADSFVIYAKKSPFGPEEIQKFIETAKNLEYEVVVPLQQGEGPYHKYTRAIFNGNRELLKEYPFELNPITDQSPYLFYSLKLTRFFSMEKFPFSEIGYLLLWLTFLIVLLISLGMIYLPVLLKKEYGKKIHISKVIFYFGGLGAGYMMVEVLLIQRIELLFSSIALSASIVFGSVFFFGGLGAYVAKQFHKKTTGLFVALPALMAVLILYLFFFDSFLNFALKFKVLYRVLWGIAFSAPISFLMGMPFSLGLEWMKYFEGKVVPWCWSVNTGFSMIGTVLAMILSIEIGFSWVWVLAVFFYGISLASFIWMDLYYQKTNYLYRRYKV
jgi:spermidine synthase